MTLRIAVEVVRNARPELRPSIVAGIGALGEKADDYFVGRLYEQRILNHIGNEDARKLAWPGLVVRRITREIARTVLGPLCDLGPEVIDAAFDRLGREVWIVTHDASNDALIHQPDLRANTLPLMRRKDKFQVIASAMVDFFSARARHSDADKAEEAYYRLLRGDDPVFLDDIWSERLAMALRPAREDFEVGSPAWCHLEARFGTRLLSRDHLNKLSNRLAWQHVARGGRSLRRLDDERIDWRAVDLAARSDESYEGDLPAKQTLLIKTGRWSVIRQVRALGGMDSLDQEAAAFLVSALPRLADGAEVAIWSYVGRALPDRASGPSRLGPGAWRALALLLPAAAQAEPEIYHRLDFYLAESLPSVRVRQATDRGALRAAVVFGSRCRATAFHLYLQSILGARQPTLSAAESRILLDSVSGGANAEKLRSAASVYPKFDDEVILREALDSLRPIAEANRRDDPARDRILRDFFSARLESWVVPVGYLLARAFGQSGWPAEVALLISRYLPSDRSAFGWLKLGRDKTPIVPRDALQVVRAIDEATGLPGFLKELVNLGALEHCPDSVRADFDVMISAITDWQIRQIDPGKFCVPGRDNRDDAERQYLLSARFFGEQGFDVADDRIFRLRYRHNGTDMTAQVGKRSAVNDEIVMAIYAFKAGKARSFLICTESRGWDLSRTPIITGSDGDDLILEVVPFAAFGRHHLPPEVPYLGLTILWVDNHPQEIRQEIAYLENLGASIDHLAAVDRAYEALNLRIPDLLISDWMQGGKQTGLPLLQWVRERGLELPTIIYTSRASIDRRELATAAGAMGCVDTPNDLYELVKRAVHPPFRPAVA